ncbi:MAG: murein biosynthesis integral membrane protein MurJ [Chloroflexota bacterium]|nr:murein biosynthesis integral membrane protein MurJ [Chloroflexota bacterium]
MAAVRLKSANKQIFRALLSLASAALLTRMVGMVNQVIVSSRFGAGDMMDAYFVAAILPTTAAYIVITAIESAVIPVYTQVRAQHDKGQASTLFSTLLNLLLLGTVFLTCVMFLFRRQVILLSAPALDPLRIDLATSLAPYMFPVLILMVIAGFLECILNAEGQFGWPAYAGLLVPLTTAFLVLIAGRSYGVLMLCVGMLLGLCLQVCAYIVRARRAKLVYRPVLDMRNPALQSILKVVWPVLLGSLVGQASPLIDQICASFLSAGSISALSYALKLVSVCSGVIFASVGRAALPYLSRQVGNHDMQAFKETLRLYLWFVGIGTILLSVFMIVLAHPIVAILFQRGAFTAKDSARTATTLVGFMVGLSPMSLGAITAIAFSALGRTRVLMGVSVFSVIANATFDFIFAHFWQSQGIALATSAVYLCTMSIMFYLLRRMVGRLDLLTPPAEALKILEKLGLRRLYKRYISGEEDTLLVHARKLIGYVTVGSVIFAIGTMVVLQNSLYALRIALGSIAMLVLLRYRYALVMIWMALSVIVSPNLSFFTNNNFLTGLTVPTLLLALHLPTGQTFKRMPALFCLLLYLVWIFAGISIAAIDAGAFLVIWLTFLDYLAVAALTIYVLSTHQRLMRLIDTIIAGGVFVSLFGIYGYVTRQNGVLDPTTGVFRIYSTFSAAPPLALFLSIVIPLAVYRASTLRGFKCIAVSLSILLLLAATGLTFARSAFISIPLSIGVMILFSPSRKMKVGLLASVVALAVGVVVFINISNLPIFNRFFNQDVTTLNGRVYLWQALLNHFQPTQLLGNGFHASDALLANLQVGFNGDLIATSPSNLFLGTLYDHGVIGLLLLIVIFGTLLTSMLRGMLKAQGEQRMLFVVALAIFISVFLQSFDVNDFWTQAVGIYFWVIMALPFAMCWSRQENPPAEDMFDKATVPQMKAIPLGRRGRGL